MDKQFLNFPDGFLWGSATAAHQIEGGNHNDWSEWETSGARITHLKEQGRDPSDFVSGKACDSYNRYPEDFDIAKNLSHNTHRMSVEWSRIEPEEGKFDWQAIRHYQEVVKAIRDRGMEPFLTLWHFTSPVWFAKQGGFLNPRSPELYKRFIRQVVDNLKGDVKLWITFNEGTSIYAGLGYLKGTWPPQHKSLLDAYRFRKNIARAHILAYREIKNIYHPLPTALQNKSEVVSHNVEGSVMVGAVESNLWPVAGIAGKLLGMEELFQKFGNEWLWSRTLPYQDFLGLNYYTIKRLAGSHGALSKQDHVPEMDWEIYPEGLYRQLMRLKRFGKPIYITENGIADAADARRAKFIKDHLAALWRAIRDGVDVRGYLYWSLLDNFEWARGYEPRFGLVAVDYATQRRTIRPSALEYAKIIQENGFETTL